MLYLLCYTRELNDECGSEKRDKHGIDVLVVDDAYALC